MAAYKNSGNKKAMFEELERKRRIKKCGPVTVFKKVDGELREIENKSHLGGKVKSKPLVAGQSKPNPLAFDKRNKKSSKKKALINCKIPGDEFLESFAWEKLRLIALKKYGSVCMCCGASPKNGAVMNVDHIKPRKLFPDLALVLDNLQVLCHDCNHGKGNWDQTDFRPME